MQICPKGLEIFNPRIGSKCDLWIGGFRAPRTHAIIPGMDAFQGPVSIVITVELAHATLIVGRDYEGPFFVTRFGDGVEVLARANNRPEDIRRARELGYVGHFSRDTTWAMSRDHEALHSWLADLEGRPSPVLWAVAHGDPPIDDGIEEARVLRLQAAVNAARSGDDGFSAMARACTFEPPELVARAVAFLEQFSGKE